MLRLDTPPDGWQELLDSDPNATAAHRPALWEALAALGDGMSPRVLAVEEGGRLIGGAPLVVQRRFGFTWLHALPGVLPAAPLASPGRHRDVDLAVAAALAALARDTGAVGGEWSLYRPQGPAVAAEALALVPGETTWLEVAVLDLADGPAAFLERMDRKTRKDIRNAEAAGLVMAEEPGALADAWALYRAQSRGRRGATVSLELARRLLAGPEPLARLFTVRDGRGLLAATLALDAPHELLPWWSGTHPDARAHHAFTFLLWTIAEWAARSGRARLNLGASPGLPAVAAFKESFGTRAVGHPVRWLAPRHASGPGRWLAAAQRVARRGRHRGDAA